MSYAVANAASKQAVRLTAAQSIAIGGQFWLDPIRCMDKYYRRYGAAIAIEGRRRNGVVDIPVIFLVGPEFNRAVLTSTDYVRPSGLWNVAGAPGSAQSDIHDSYLSTHGDEHAAVSQLAVPHLRKSRVEQHFNALKAIVLEEIETWPVRQKIDLYGRIREMAQRASFTLLFGDTDIARGRNCGKLLADYHDANWSTSAHVLPFSVPGSRYQEVQRRADHLRSFLVDWVAERRGCPVDQDLRASFANKTDTSGHHLRAGRIAGYFSFLAFASYETMSSALTWTLLQLAQNQDAVGPLRDEIAASAGVADISRDELVRLPNLDGVLNESMRLIPPTPYIALSVLKPWEIAGCRLRKGTEIIISPHLTHRLPEIYADPNAFRPGRWQTISPGPYEFLPFSGGPRRCPGAQFGTDFMKLALTALIQRYDVSIRPGGKAKGRFTGITMPRSDIPVMLTPVAPSARQHRAA